MNTYNQQEFLQNYAKQDERLQDPKVQAEIIANNRGLNFEQALSIGRGTREIHEVNIFGKIVPMRVLSMREEVEMRHATHVEMNKDPIYQYFKNDSVEFNKVYLRKCISLSTTPAIEYTSDDKRNMTEDDINALPPSTFASLVTTYQALELEYNPQINEVPEKEVNLLLSELFDPLKKSVLLTGMTSSQLRAALSRCLDVVSELKDNIGFMDLLQNTTKSNSEDNNVLMT